MGKGGRSIGRFLSAFLSVRNVLIGALALAAATVSHQSFLRGTPAAHLSFALYLAAASVFLGSGLQTLLSKAHGERYAKRRTFARIREADKDCKAKAKRLSPNLRNLPANVRGVLADKDVILGVYFDEDQTYIQEKVALQSLELTNAYLRQYANYSMRKGEVEKADIQAITSRINGNLRKIGFTSDDDAKAGILDNIAMDERLLSSIKGERVELAKVMTKLEYMESVIGSLKHKVVSGADIGGEISSGKVQSIIDEATALDSALESRRGEGLRLR
ncbi:MAG: hypothetical protein FWE70_05765 [Oscillospiraceae bacterium]|nr:hypothetical protein [Oscillospiraceae bacterium]